MSIDTRFAIPNLTMGAESVLTSTYEKTGHVLLNRPKALNALNLDMIEKMHNSLQAMEENPNVEVIFMAGNGQKAFCAGGDVRAIYDEKKEGVSHNMQTAFFAEEYRLDYLIANLKTPYVSLLDGITMGGGVGISVHGKYRIATENSVFSMPETALGLFPDVGGAHFLPRLPQSIGYILGLTGYRLKGFDLYFAGIATHCVPYEDLEELLQKSLDYETFSKELEKLHNPPLHPRDELFENLPQIECCFQKETVEEIIACLRESESPLAQQLISSMESASPTSLKVTLAQLRRGAELDLKHSLEMEYRMTQNFMNNVDFFEGVRSILVDKDRNPKWSPADLSEVSDDDVAQYFKSISPDLILQ